MENLKKLYIDTSRKEQANQMTREWYENLWDDSLNNLDDITKAISIRKVDVELTDELNLLRSMITKSQQTLKYSNKVNLISGGPGYESRIIRNSTVTLIPVLSREGLSFRVFGQNFDGGIITTDAEISIDESVPNEEQGIYDIRMIEGIYPAFYSDGKFIMNVQCGSPKTTMYDGKPAQMVFDDQKMDVTYEIPVSDDYAEIRQGVMFLQN